jgi:hypothetical protein
MPKITRLLGYQAAVDSDRLPAGPPDEQGQVEFVDVKILRLVGDNEIIEYPMNEELAQVVGGKLQGHDIAIAQAVPRVPFLDREQHKR